MIKTDGYYVENPVEIEDGRSNPTSYSYLFLAYLFDSEFNVYWSSQHQRLSELVDFKKSFFEISKATAMNWRQKENSIIIEKESEFSKDIIVQMISDDKLYNPNSKTYLHFVPWTRSASNKEPGAILKSIFGPFEKGKFKRVQV